MALALAVACLAAFAFSRVQVNRARDDFSNAFFYAPSQKEHHRQRRRRWTDISRALLVATALAGALTAWLYVTQRPGLAAGRGTPPAWGSRKSSSRRSA